LCFDFLNLIRIPIASHRSESTKPKWEKNYKNNKLPKNFGGRAEEKGFPGCHLLRRLNHLGKIARENDAAKETCQQSWALPIKVPIIDNYRT
jgi:hypothetical protein